MEKEKIINIKRPDMPGTVNIPTGTIFHFDHSLRPFMAVTDGLGNPLFIDLENAVAMGWDELIYDNLFFYEEEDNDDFLGVAVICNFRDIY